MSTQLSQEIKKFRAQGMSYKAIKKQLGCSLSTVAYHCNDNTRTKYLERGRKHRKRKKLKLPLVKEIKFKPCKKCKIDIPYGRNHYCENCNPNKVDWSKVTIKDLKDKLTKQGSTLRFHARLRGHCRDAYKKYYKKICVNCGYNKHTDVCHIKSIASFPETTPISVVNDKSNIIELCKNCHWEFDNGLITLQQMADPRLERGASVYETDMLPITNSPQVPKSGIEPPSSSLQEKLA